MKKRRRARIFAVLGMSIWLMTFFSGCKNETQGNVSRSYYIISEELDKTTDKLQEILENRDGSILETGQ